MVLKQPLCPVAGYALFRWWSSSETAVASGGGYALVVKNYWAAKLAVGQVKRNNI